MKASSFTQKLHWQSLCPHGDEDDFLLLAIELQL
jgi:hypothetical protein